MVIFYLTKMESFNLSEKCSECELCLLQPYPSHIQKLVAQTRPFKEWRRTRKKTGVALKEEGEVS